MKLERQPLQVLGTVSKEVTSPIFWNVRKKRRDLTKTSVGLGIILQEKLRQQRNKNNE